MAAGAPPTTRTDSKSPFEAPPDLQEYMVPDRVFIERNPQHNILAVGAVVFNSEGRMLLVQRAADEKAFPNFWEIPGGKVDDTDETVLHAVVRELREEAGLDTKRIVRKVGVFDWNEVSKRTGKPVNWHKIIFEVEVKDMEVVLDPVEHQNYLFATEEQVANGKAGEVVLSYITPLNKAIKLEAFKLKRGAISG
ncbi:hypothetical protein CC78DRAFT_499971 [Lojkania enalia]|uniref:Nudix hydrolase domain-containing protein n=1 Tax=Lojkania enalia TaxID=147567 RepID=A0A9P4N770_9PLEO|nr:hypothetical protein CC78DRAFT_499971 [Didymosphaeria enalia]